ncbi:hypothetical protein BJX62DRAFT_249632 [Aspergillus germanicus]
MLARLPSGIFCGAQSLPSSNTYESIRLRFCKDPGLQHLAQAVLELPALWSSLSETHAFCNAAVGDPLKSLSDWIASDNPRCFTVPESLPNVLLAPLTVVLQLVQYTQYLREQHHAGISHQQILQSVSSPSAGIQGLCSGFLTATALACSRDLDEVITNGAVAIRLAMCIGAAVDAQERKKEGASRTQCLVVDGSPRLDRQEMMTAFEQYPSVYVSVELDAHRVTITAADEDVPSLSQHLIERGIKVKPLSLKGRYHNAVHQDVSAVLRKICNETPCLRFPEESKPLVPLRYNSTGDLVQPRDILHEVCLRSLLVEPANWYSTVSASVAGLKKENALSHMLLELGFGSCLPRSLAIRSCLDVVSVPLDGDDGPFSYPDHSIAIVGAAGRFAGAANLNQLWNLIRTGASTVSAYNQEGATPVRDSQTRRGNYFSNVDAFDAKLFGYSPKEAQFMDPQHRVALQVAYEAVEGAGYMSPGSCLRKDIGCYVGIATSDYEANVACHRASAFSFTGTARSFVSGRISHYFGWTGPSVAIDTACSSSAVAINMACKEVMTKGCKMALAGGVNIITNCRTTRNLAAANFLSASSGPCRSFDEAADGFSRGEGCGFILLKRLDDALAEGDQILGVIVGIATNQNTNCDSITVPVHESQVDVYRRSLAASGIDRLGVSYVEAHGTGTTRGDPIEYHSIRQVFGGRNGRSQPLYVGSVKANIGHTEAASGVASVLKVLLMMRHGQLPPQANFARLNPAIASLDSDQISISTALQPWESRFRVASINNYGASGNNTAMIVCQPPNVLQYPKWQQDALRYPFLLSANTKASLRKVCESLQQFIALALQPSSGPPLRLADLAIRIGSTQNQRLPYRVAFHAGSIAELQDHLQRYIMDDGDAALIPGPASARPVVMVFAGQTGNAVQINKDAYDCSALLKSHLDRCDTILREMGRPSLFPSIFVSKREDDVVLSHCMLFAAQYSCAMAWIDAGLPVRRLIGHSIGQLTALCVAGCISLQDAITLIAGRASLIKEQWGSETGVMLALTMDRSSTEKLVTLISEGRPDYAVEIACYNAPTRHILVGTEAAIGKVLDLVSQENNPRRLKTTHGFHSRLADSILPSYEAIAHSISYHDPTIPIETCSPESSWARVTAHLVAQQTRQPVYFVDAIRRIEEKLGPCIWLEAGTESSGITLAQHALRNPRDHSFHTVQLAASNPIDSLQRTTQQLWLEGMAVQFWLYHQIGRSSSSLSWPVPGYQFDESHHWVSYEEPDKAAIGDDNPLIISSPTNLITLVAKFSIATHNEEYQGWLSCRVVLGSYLCSIGSYVELATRAAVLLPPGLEQHDHFQVSNLSLCAPLGIQVDSSLTLTLRPTTVPSEWEFSIDSDIQHARGHIGVMPMSRTSARSCALQRLIDHRYCQGILADPIASTLAGPLAYKILERVVECAPSYRGIQSTTIRDLEAVTRVTISQEQGQTKSLCSPPTLDHFILAAEMHILSLQECSQQDVFVCSEITAIIPLASAPLSRRGSWMVYTKLSWADERSILCDTLVFDTASQQSILALLGARYTRASINSLRKAISLANSHKEQQQKQTMLDVSPCHQPLTPARPLAPPTPPVAATPTESVNEKLKAIVSDLTGIPPSRFLSKTTLAELGIDSLTTIELQRLFNQTFQVDLPKVIDNEHYTIGDLSAAAGAVGIPQLQPEQLKLCRESCPQSAGLMTPPSAPTTPLFSEGERANISETLQHSSVCEIITRLIMIVAAQLNCPDKIVPSIQLQHLGLESLGSMDLEAELANAFGRNVNLRKMSPTSTFGDLMNLVLSSHGQPSLLFESLSWFANIRHTYSQFARMARFTGFYARVYPRQMRLLTSYIIDAFGALGCKLRDIPAGESVPRIPHIPRYTKLVDHYYRILGESGHIQRDKVNGDAWIRTSNAIIPDPAPETYQAVWTDFPAYRPEHKLLHCTGSRLADCLSGQADPLYLLFRDPKAHELLENVYADCPMFKTGTLLLGNFLQQVALPCSPGRLRILELGAGTGGTTKYILKQLRSRKINFHYTFSDISPALVARAQDRLAGDEEAGDAIDFTVLDIELPPQHEHVHAYDVVISANCVHATKDLGVSCTNICALLRPKGMLCLLELTRDVYWLDGVFGLLDGWWRFDDGRVHALVDERQWKDCLQRAGFAHVDWSDDESMESDVFRLICAMKP